MSQDINSIIPNASIANSIPKTQSMIPSFVAFGVFILFMLYNFYSQNKYNEKREKMINSLMIDDIIQTYGGIIGKIVFISEDKKMLEMKTGLNFETTITINRQSIDQKLDNKS